MLAALLYGAVHAPGAYAHHGLSRHLGVPVVVTTSRIVRIDAATSVVAAAHGETLTIVNGKGQSFTWRLDTLHVPTGFPLKSIAPPDFEAGDTWVYVGPQPHPN